MPAIQNVERRGAVYYWRRTVRFQDGKPFTLRLSLRTTTQSVARHMGTAMTAKSEMLKMDLSPNGRSATLTTLQKAGIFRTAMEEMRDHLEQTHVGYRRGPSAVRQGCVGCRLPAPSARAARSYVARQRAGSDAGVTRPAKPPAQRADAFPRPAAQVS